MTCTETRLQLMDYAWQRLSAVEAGDVDAHLSECPECRGVLEQERAAGECLASFETVAPRNDLWDAVRARRAALAAAADMPKPTVAPRASGRWAARGWALGLTAGIAALALMLAPSQREPQTTSGTVIAQTLDQAREVARESDDPMADVSAITLIAISNDGKDASS